ncbi:thioredoxin [Acholeplasma sp. OttesenSCG-928-E16]|nr:thioredoxin [Acholeplasma sp. OttesenSCG-928-E16]
MEYKGQNINEMIKDKKVLLKFYATWCGPCKMISPIIDEINQERSDIELISIDIDEYRDIAVDFGVRGVPTIVILDNGKEVNRKSGFAPKEDILALL